MRKDKRIKKLDGANLDIDLVTDSRKISWQQDLCPWNKKDKTNTHRCAVKNVSICPYFCGIKYLDFVLCSYPNQNPYKKTSK
ncbi:hypothetical protein ACFLZP_04220 [Patescibacteria group bacterium]